MAFTLTRRDFLKLSLITAGQAGTDWLAHGPTGGLKGVFVPLMVDATSHLQVPDVCPALAQSPWLGMAALGDNTMPDPNTGNHLRWAFDPRLGFPAGGFDLYRRPHFDGQPTCVTLQRSHGNQNLGRRTTLGDLLLESTADIITVELVAANGATPEIDLRKKPALSIWPREVCHRIQVHIVDFDRNRGTIQATAYDGGVAVDTAQTVVSKDIQVLDLAAYRIDHVVISATKSSSGPAAMNGVLTQICYTTIAGDACQPNIGWTRLNQTPICLPLSDPNYPAPCRLPDPADEWPTARRRIPADIWGTYDPPEFTDLRDTLAGIYNPSGAPLTTTDVPCPPASGDEGTPEFVHDPLGVVLLTTLDTHIARMLGLYWIDGTFYVGQGLQGPTPATAGKPYDYLIVAHYPATAESADACDDWEVEAAGTVVNDTVPHGSLTYTTSVALSVVNRSIAAFGTAQALSIPDNLGSPLRITLPEPAQAVELYVDVPDANARAIARAYAQGVEVDTHTRSASVNGPTILLLTAESIDTVELEGRNLYLAKTCYYTDYLPGGDMGFIVYNVTLGVPPALPPPASLNGDPLPVLTHVDENCDPVTGQMAAGLRWDRDLAGDDILPGGAALYDLERQALGDGNTPGGVDPAGWEPAKSNLLISPSPPEASCEPYEPLPGWSAQRPDYIDMPVAPQQRWYAYRVRGKDIFGRTSDYRVSTPIDLGDFIPPPPPADVQASYLDSNDPYLALDEQAWTHPAAGPRHGLRVGWRWTQNLREQAPDVAQFRVYFKSGRLNVILGHITAVDPPDASGNVRLTTDIAVASLPAGDVADAFQGERLSQGDHVYHVIASGSAGGFLTLTFKRVVWSPPAVPGMDIVFPELQPIPILGAFSLSIRPRKLLAGLVTAMSADEFSDRVTIETDVRYTGAANDLAGLKLRQGGRLWDIIGNTTGWKFAIYLKQRACDPLVPERGASFLVVEADGTTPRLLDAGNVHARDYRDPLQWEQRLHLEPRTEEPTGLITSVVDNGDGTSTVTTNATLSDPAGHYLGGELQVGNHTWPVIGHTTGSNFQLTVRHNRRNQLTGTVDQVAPSAGASLTYWPDIVMPIAPLTIAPGQPAAYAAVGVSAADDKTYVTDAWTGINGGQPGNESRVSPPVILARLDHSTPPASTPNTDVLMATPADFFGRSFFTVRWTKRPEPGLRYHVYRALAEPDGSEPPLTRYILLTREPLRPADHPDFAEPGHATVDPTLVAYRDTLDGKSSSRYYYRVRAVNAAGTLGTWSAAIGPVACPDVVPPRTPAITKVLGGDREITLKWASNRETDLAEYRVYRADSEAAAGDLRLMTLVHTEPAPAGDPMGRPAEVVWIDQTVPGLANFFYRMTAVDNAGNESSPSASRMARPYRVGPPEAPYWVSAERITIDDSSVIRLVWALLESIEVMVQRRRSGTAIWSTLAGWLPQDSTMFDDTTADLAVEYEYRLKGRDASGRQSEASDVVTVPPGL